MNKRIFTTLFGLLLVVLIVGFLFKVNTITTIIYFPIDVETSFNYGKTSLTSTTTDHKDTYNITWKSDSQTSKTLYLRQDVSLLYENGKLRGVRSKWIEDTDSITFEEEIFGKENSLFQAISYHHGEIHYPNDKIKSVQLMSHDHLYVANNPGSIQKEELELLTKKQLLQHWNGLINHFNVKVDNYITVPLSELYKFNNENIPTLTKEQTDKIIGQLWEGLYKNYIIPIASTKSENFTNYIPLVLFNKDNTHLLVLFELNGSKEKLIQQYAN